MWSPLLLILSLSVHTTAVILTGPDILDACQTYQFFLTEGTSPYILHPLVGTGSATDGLVERTLSPLQSNSFLYFVSDPPGAVLAFFVTDAKPETSNTLQYTVQGSGACPTTLTIGVPATTNTTESATVGASSTVLVSGSTATTQYSSVVAATIFTQTRVPFPVDTPVDAFPVVRVSVSTLITVGCTVGGALFLVICFFCWRWYRTRKARQVQRRSQPRQLMMNADQNNSGLLLTGPVSSSREYGAVPSTPTNGDPTTSAPPAVFVLPTMKERRMRGAVNRGPDLEDGLSISDISSPMSTAHSTSIWPASSAASHEESPSRSQFPPTALRNQQSLQAIIGREIQQILQNPHSRASPTSFTNTPSPFSSSNDLQSSDASRNEQAPIPILTEKPTLSLDIPGTPQTNRDPRSILQSTTTPISRRDMEVLADLVAQRLIRDRAVESPTLDRNPEAPPPRYS